MFYFLIKTFKKRIAAAFACLVLCTAVYQAEISAQLLYSAHLVYNEQVQIAFELKNMITAVQSGKSEIPVAFVGTYESNYRRHKNFLLVPGGALGKSFFGANPNNHGLDAMRGLDFLETLGIHFEAPGYGQLDRALKEGKSMPSYPDPGCVKRLPGRGERDGDVIVVKMGDLAK